MKRAAHLIVLASLMLPAVAQQPPREPQEPQGKPAAGASKAPLAREQAELALGQRLDGSVVVVDLDGKPCKLQDLLGKVTVLNFHATQSKSQREADAHFATLQDDYQQHDVAFLHINSNATEIGLRAQRPAANQAGDKAGSPKPYARIHDYLRKHKLPFRVFADHHNRLADALGALTTPHVFVFAGDGTLVYRGPAIRAEHKYLSDVLAKLVAGAKVKPLEALPLGNAISRVKAPTKALSPTVVVDDALLAHKTALREGKLLLYNFTAFNCMSCRVMESTVFQEPASRELMGMHLVEARLHTDTQSTMSKQQFANNRKLQMDLTAMRNNPMYVVVNPATGEKLGTFKLSGDFGTWGTKWRTFVTEVATKAGRIAK